jgi:hypothetical protein
MEKRRQEKLKILIDVTFYQSFCKIVKEKEESY